MKYRKRTIFTEADKALMWDRWEKGESLHAIAELFDRHHPSIQRILAATGGIRPDPSPDHACGWRAQTGDRNLFQLVTANPELQPRRYTADL